MIARLREHPGCTKYFREMTDLIEYKMFVVDPQNRATISVVKQTLETIYKFCLDPPADETPSQEQGQTILEDTPDIPSQMIEIYQGPTQIILQIKQRVTTSLTLKRHLEDSPDPPQTNYKRSKHSLSLVAYNCPFRKRNPLRFNFRDYSGCALLKFPDISKVK